MKPSQVFPKDPTLPDKVVDNIPITDHNYQEVLDRSFVDVKNESFTATEKVKPVLDTDFMKTSQNFWLTHDSGRFITNYNEGVMAGTFNARQPNLKAVLETILEALKNIIRMQCEQEDKTPEDFATYMEMLETTFRLISEKADNVLDERIEGELIMSYLHATINSFVNTNIKVKE